jgi:hypothetical protein
MQTDIKAASMAAGGTAYAGRTRVRGLLVEPGLLTGYLKLRDGGSSGPVVMTVNTVANGEPFSVVIPAEGILFQYEVYAELSQAKATVFYG